jgi:hypothetical protein
VDHNSGIAQRRPRYLPAVVLSLVLVLAVLGVVFAVRGVMQAHRERSAGTESSSPSLSERDRQALGISGTPKVLWDPDAARALGEYLERHLGGPGVKFYEINLYTNYAFATSKDASDPSIAVHAELRQGQFTTAAVNLVGGGRSIPTFGVSEVPWASLESLMDEAVRQLDVQDADVRYLEIDSGVYGTTGLTMRFYASGPRSPGGYVVTDARGAITRVVRDSA